MLKFVLSYPQSIKTCLKLLVWLQKTQKFPIKPNKFKHFLFSYGFWNVNFQCILFYFIFFQLSSLVLDFLLMLLIYILKLGVVFFRSRICKVIIDLHTLLLYFMSYFKIAIVIPMSSFFFENNLRLKELNRFNKDLFLIWAWFVGSFLCMVYLLAKMSVSWVLFWLVIWRECTDKCKSSGYKLYFC